MNKKSFALSWGRKMFFGHGWALTSILGLIYLQSMIFPQTFGGWFYFLTTFIGHYGMILILSYFFLYCPIILIFPTYYISRIWSIVLMLAINLVIFFDAYLFARYQFHLNSFLLDILKTEKSLQVFGLSPVKQWLMAFVTFIFFILFWIRGENIWRKMCGRFSNPVKNWYLVLIVSCFLTSNLIHMYSSSTGGGQVTQLASLFPVHFPLTAESFMKEHGFSYQKGPNKTESVQNFYYPSSPLKCTSKNPKNILMVVLDKWPVNWDKTLTPNLTHYLNHGLFYTNHFSGSPVEEEGYFSLLYGVPSVYLNSAAKNSKEPAVYLALKESKMEMGFFKNQTLADLAPFLESKVSPEALTPFFAEVYLKGGTLAEKDEQLKEVINSLIRTKLTENTIIIMTGATGEGIETPLLLIWPNKRPETINKLTTHYDVLASVIIENWKCKNKASEISLGKNLFSKEETLQHVAGNNEELFIVDSKSKSTVVIDHSEKIHLIGNGNPEMKEILNALHRMTHFFRP
jgi:membrane-anchored protein YejM (alkaline phosphatase superfamily)